MLPVISASIIPWCGPICLAGCLGIFCVQHIKLPLGGENNERNLSKAQQERVREVFKNTIIGLSVTMGVAVLAHFSKLSFFVMGNLYAVPCILLLAAIGMKEVTERKDNQQKIAWILSQVAMGIIVSTMGVLCSSGVLLQAALLSVGVGSALCYVAYGYKMDGVETTRQQLQVIFGTIAIGSFLTGMFPGTAMAYGLNKLFIYGSIAIYGFFFMTLTNEIVKRAENDNFDPIRDSLGLYLNALNFLLRITNLLKRNQHEASF